MTMTSEELRELMRTRRKQFFERYPSAETFLRGYGSLTSLLEGIYAGEKDNVIFREIFQEAIRKGVYSEDDLLELGGRSMKRILARECHDNRGRSIKNCFPRVTVMRYILQQCSINQAVDILDFLDTASWRMQNAAVERMWYPPERRYAAATHVEKMSRTVDFYLMMNGDIERMKEYVEYVNIIKRMTGETRHERQWGGGAENKSENRFRSFNETVLGITKQNPLPSMNRVREVAQQYDQIDGQYLEIKYKGERGKIEDAKWISPFTTTTSEGIEIDGYEFTPLLTVGELEAEAVEMDHCVGHYARNCLSKNPCHIYRIDGKVRGTMEVLERITPEERTFNCRQLAGRQNVRISTPELEMVVNKFLDMCKKELYYQPLEAANRRDLLTKSLHMQADPVDEMKGYDFLVEYIPELEKCRPDYFAMHEDIEERRAAQAAEAQRFYENQYDY